ncbi:MAG: EAL domain-containing protein [Burkholderiales bacterium]|nr:EAL domain-containing protein [Burkholderiales bacterium]
MTTSPSAARRPLWQDVGGWMLPLFCALTTILVWTAALERGRADRLDRFAHQERDNANLAIEAAAQVRAGLHEVEQLLSILGALHQAGVPASGLGRLLGAVRVDRRVLETIGLFDAQGRRVFASPSAPLPGAAGGADVGPELATDVSTSPSFRFHATHPDGRVLVGPAGPAGVVLLSQRVTEPDGHFGGMAVAEVRLGGFATAFDRSRLRPQDYLALVSDDGTPVDLRAGGISRPGSGPAAAFLAAARGGPATGSYRGPIGPDRVRRLVAYRQLEGYPLWVVAGTAEAGLLARVIERQHLYLGIAALLSLLIAAFAGGGLWARARERRLGATLQASERRYRTLIERAPDAIVSCDDAGHILGWNLAAERVFGYAARDVLAGPITRLLPRRSWRPLFEHMRAVVAGGGGTGAALSIEARTRGGQEFPAMVSLAQWQSAQGPMHTAIIRDMSELQAAHERTLRLSRLYRALSECNHAIVHSADADELFQRVCRTAVEAAGLSMACVMLVADDQRTVKPAAAHGSGLDFLRTARVTVAEDDPHGQGLIGTAIRQNQPQWTEDYASDPRTAPWRERAREFGWVAGAALPLQRGGLVVGTLFLFAGITQAFDPAVRALLVEMAADISHALTGFARQAELRDQERVLKTLGRAIEQSPVSVLVVDLDGRIAFANPKVEQITGYRREELLGQNPRLFKSGQTPEEVYRQLWAALAGGTVWQGELCNRRKDGSLFWEHASISPIVDETGRTISYLAVKEDITERKAQQAQIEHLAFFDPLTHLPNRSLLADRLTHALAAAGRSGRPGALLFIDLDDFKTVNDTLGHEVGDQLLLQVARRLVNCLREADTVARLGGDEFVVLLEDLKAPLSEAVDQVETIGEKIRTALHQPYQLAGHQQRSSASIGVACFGELPISVDELMKRADLAMYQAKAAGRDTLRFYEPAIQEQLLRRASLESDLHRGIHEGQLLLHYQPQVDARCQVTGAEALVRWQHPARGLVPPGEFIALAEATGLIQPLGRWVLQTACRQLAAWAAAPGTRALTLAVNVSARQFLQPDFVEQVLAALGEAGAEPSQLKLELTESMLLSNLQDVIEKMHELKAWGVNFSLDDFGTGYSSLTYLKRLPLQQLKIDQSFVRDVLSDPNDAAIARTIVALARSLGLEVIAEGVETEAQRDFLAGIGCLAYQGYLYSRPLGIEAFQAFLGRA